jgi:hypothetical protein
VWPIERERGLEFCILVRACVHVHRKSWATSANHGSKTSRTYDLIVTHA